MAIDNDLSALLPDPPPPRPARREAAIDEAVRRFDGAPPPTPAPTRPVAASRSWGRPQVAALASVALVVLVSVPVWWAERDRVASPGPPAAVPASPAANAATARPRSQQSIPAALPQQSPPAAVAATPAAPTTSAAVAPAPQIAAPDAQPAARSVADERVSIESNVDRLPAFVPRATPAPPPPPRAAAARRAEAEADTGQRITVTGARIQRQDQSSPTPMVTVNEDVLEASFNGNACTVLDRRRNLDACRAVADPSGRGATGSAGAQLADGLTFAWQGQLDRAIGAFDRAIDAAPDKSIAYLNRGLAYQERGDLRRALADLDRAVARDRNDARNYYHRSLIQRARGNAARADADARRAIELDPAYAAVLP